MQTVAPSSIIAWLNTDGLCCDSFNRSSAIC